MSALYHSIRRVGATFPGSIEIVIVRDAPDGETARTVCFPAGSEIWTSGVSP